MTTIRLRFCACVVAALAAPAAPPAFAIPPEQAADAVRAFEERPGMQVPPARQDVDSLGRNVYRFRFGPLHEVSVAVESGSIVQAFLPTPRRYPTPQQRLDRDAAVRLARAFAEAHYPEFMRRVISVHCVPNAHPMVVFAETIPGTGALTANHLTIDLDGGSHTVCHVSFADMPIPPAVAAPPAVSGPQATAIAARQLGIRVAAVNRSALAAAPCFGRRNVWTLDLLCDPGDGLLRKRTVSIDAQTGELLAVGAPRGSDAAGAADGSTVLTETAGKRRTLVLTLRPRAAGGVLFMPVRFAELLGMKRFAVPFGAAALRGPTGATAPSEVSVTMLDGQECVPVDWVLKPLQKGGANPVGRILVDPDRCALLVDINDPAIIDRAIAWGIATPVKRAGPNPKMAPWHVPYSTPGKGGSSPVAPLLGAGAGLFVAGVLLRRRGRGRRAS